MQLRVNSKRQHTHELRVFLISDSEKEPLVQTLNSHYLIHWFQKLICASKTFPNCYHWTFINHVVETLSFLTKDKLQQEWALLRKASSAKTSYTHLASSKAMANNLDQLYYLLQVLLLRHKLTCLEWFTVQFLQKSKTFVFSLPLRLSSWN